MIDKEKIESFIIPRNYKKEYIEKINELKKINEEILKVKNPTWNNFILPYTKNISELESFFVTAEFILDVNGTQGNKNKHKQIKEIYTNEFNNFLLNKRFQNLINEYMKTKNYNSLTKRKKIIIKGLKKENRTTIMSENYKVIYDMKRSMIENKEIRIDGKLRKVSDLSIHNIHNEKEREKFYKIKKENDFFTIFKILKEREKLAKKNGYENYSSFVFENLMYKNKNEILSKLYNMAEKNLSELKKRFPDLEKEDGFNFLFNVYKEKEAEYYFDYKKVKKAIINFIEEFYDLKIEADEDLSNIKINDKNGKNLGIIYASIFSDGKKINASYSSRLDFVKQKTNGIILNIKSKDLTVDDVQSLLHEFSHGLHDILSKEKCPNLGGILIEDDISEVPALFFEKILFDEDFFKQITSDKKNYKLKLKEIKDKYIEEMIYDNLEAIAISILDIELHSNNFKNEKELELFMKNINKKIFNDVDYEISTFEMNFVFGDNIDYASKYHAYIMAEIFSCSMITDYKRDKNSFAKKFKNFIEKEDNVSSLRSIKEIINIKESDMRYCSFYKL